MINIRSLHHHGWEFRWQRTHQQVNCFQAYILFAFVQVQLVAGIIPHDTTNNQAEYAAVIAGLKVGIALCRDFARMCAGQLDVATRFFSSLNLETYLLNINAGRLIIELLLL